MSKQKPKNSRLGKADFNKRFAAGLKELNKGDLPAAEKIYRSLDNDYPDQGATLANLGMIVLKRQRYEEALGIFQHYEKNNPKDIDAKNKVVVAAIHLGDHLQAEIKAREALAINADHYLSLLNLCAALGYQKKDQEGLTFAMRAITIDPTNPIGYVQLGGHFQALAMYKEAKEAFATAHALDPKNIMALGNLGVMCSQADELADAEKYYKAAIDLCGPLDIERKAQSEFFLGITLLKMGRLAEGWKYYESGFSPVLPQGRTPRRTFNAPRWSGEKIFGKRLLLWREQGLGDELIFLKCLQRIQERADDVTVEVDSRLLSAFTRTYPKITFRPERYGPAPHFLSATTDFDLHAPIGSAFGVFYDRLEAFEDEQGCLVLPDKSIEERYSRRVNLADGRLKVGICWRSGLLAPTRNRHYTNISQWSPVFALKDHIDFFSLQYGDCDAELARAQEEFGVYINKWPDIDYKNDLESIFALASLCDVVVTVGTAVSTLAAAVGTKVLLMAMPGWPCFGTTRFPPFANVEVFAEAHDGDVAHQLIPVARRLAEFADKKKAGGYPGL